MKMSRLLNLILITLFLMSSGTHAMTTDNDNDGIPDRTETGINGLTGHDIDGDGVDDFIDPDLTGGTDNNNDGIDDAFDLPDTDEDGIPDFRDSDSDDDGIPDATEGSADTDNDSIGNYRDTDSDGDGISDHNEAGLSGNDSDGDDIDDHFDADADGDGSTDSGKTDTAGNGIDETFRGRNSDEDNRPDFLDPDSDGDGIPDFIETESDTDQDGTANYLDTDSDNDGLSDNAESAASNSDTDNDGIDNAFDADADGGGGTDVGKTDDNADGIIDNPDLDSDDNGTDDYLEFPQLIFDETQDDDDDGIPNRVECTDPDNCLNTDGTDAPDVLDTDSDNDGLNDIEERGPDGTVPWNTDGDEQPNFRDTDSDNDGLPDEDETGDTDQDGIPDVYDHSENRNDRDQVPDQIECPEYPGCPDTDKDGQPDYADDDSDNDGISDRRELKAQTDTDGDGIADRYDADADNDGITDSDKTDFNRDGIADRIAFPDLDSDGIPDFRDNDSDNDGISDTTDQQPGIEIDNSTGAGNSALPFMVLLFIMSFAGRCLAVTPTLGAGVTYGQQNVDSGHPDFRAENNTLTGRRLELGLQFSDHWQISVSETLPGVNTITHRTDRSNRGRIQTRITAVDAQYRFTALPYTGNIQPFLSMGIARFRQTTDQDAFLLKKDNQIRPFFGAGLSLPLTEEWHSDIRLNMPDSTDHYLFSVNLTYRFGTDRRRTHQPQVPAIHEIRYSEASNKPADTTVINRASCNDVTAYRKNYAFIPGTDRLEAYSRARLYDFTRLVTAERYRHLRFYVVNPVQKENKAKAEVIRNFLQDHGVVADMVTSEKSPKLPEIKCVEPGNEQS